MEDGTFIEFEGSSMLLRIAWWMACEIEWLDWCVENDACPKWEYELEGGVFDVCPKEDKCEGLALGGRGLWLRLKGVDTLSIWDMEWAGTGEILTWEFEPRWLGEVGLHWFDIGGDVLAIKWLREVDDCGDGLDFQGPWIWNKLFWNMFILLLDRTMSSIYHKDKTAKSKCHLRKSKCLEFYTDNLF